MSTPPPSSPTAAFEAALLNVLTKALTIMTTQAELADLFAEGQVEAGGAEAGCALGGGEVQLQGKPHGAKQEQEPDGDGGTLHSSRREKKKQARR